MDYRTLKDLGPVNDDEVIHVVMLLSRFSAEKRAEVRRSLQDDESRSLALESLTKLHGASDESFAAVRRFAATHGLRVDAERELPADVTLSGTARRIRAAFGVELRRVSDGATQYRAPTGAIELPPELADYVVGVLGFDTRPVVGPLGIGRARTDAHELKHIALPTKPGRTLFTALDLAHMYNFPQGLDGSGQKVGIIIPCGGLPVQVLAEYFARLGLKVPSLTIVEVDGAKNEPASLDDIRDFVLHWGLEQQHSHFEGAEEAARARTRPTTETHLADQASWDLLFTMEIMMDVEILGAVANGAEIRVYRTPADLPGVYDAILRAADDGVTILSSSWGAAEGDIPDWPEKIERAIEYAVQKGVTLLFASGDRGSTPSAFSSDQDKLQPCYPASSPWVVACGGTTMEPAYRRPPNEVVWNEVAIGQQLASSGGFSNVFTRPQWQTGVKGAMRGVPDISANAALKSGVWLWFGKVSATSFGTSAAVQLLAGLTARLYQGLGRSVPLLNSVLYKQEVREAMRPITMGNNVIRPNIDMYHAAPGWNACTGLGRPDGERLLEALRKYCGPNSR
ncbi:S53 family peptidase [Sorangium sp. So ce448]|uniref:S53 family peptidase n=1 Tax=Sorangium sp. So ce448 TaxID=3133314 RepID=UPI003F6089E8